MAGALHLVLGGMRSGKSAHAQWLAVAHEQGGCEVLVVATALAGDDEMRARIARHRADRPAHWRTLELATVPMALADAIDRESTVQRCLLIDCMTLWLTQLIAPPPRVAALDAAAEIAALLGALERAQGPVIVVGNEIGQGVIPQGAVSRRVIDALGRLHQQIAARANRVSWMVAGLAVAVKEPPA